tara:strand:- start:16371 stop:16898 length:528 start_codon:yes stop_codon:yes gene_type:complete
MGFESSSKNYVVGSERGWALIKYIGVYDFDLILKTITNEWGKKYYTLIDKEHSEKVNADGSDIKIDRVAFRNASWFVRFFMQVELVVPRNVNVMVEVDGKKVKKQQGDLEIRIKAHLEKDYKGTFKNSKFKKFLMHIYERFIAYQELRRLRNKLRRETEFLIEELKNVLDLNKRV